MVTESHSKWTGRDSKPIQEHSNSPQTLATKSVWRPNLPLSSSQFSLQAVCVIHEFFLSWTIWLLHKLLSFLLGNLSASWWPFDRYWYIDKKFWKRGNRKYILLVSIFAPFESIVEFPFKTGLFSFPVHLLDNIMMSILLTLA